MGRKYDYNYIIIGGHPASYTLGIALQKAGKRLAIIENPTISGYVDSGTYDVAKNFSLDFSHNYYRLSQDPAAHKQIIRYNLPTLVAESDYALATLKETYIKTLEGVTIKNGHVHFLSDHSIALNDTEYTSDNFIIATPPTIKTTEISGLDRVDYLTPDTAFRIRRLPECVLVVGGGPAGVEIANFYAELGTQVIIMERAARLLPKEDKEVSDAIYQHFTENLGITVLDNSRLVALDRDATSSVAIFTNKTQEKMVRIDCVVLATGTSPNIEDLGLDNTSVKYKRTGILVDKYLTSSAKNIYCIGAATGDASPERTLSEAKTLTNNLIGKLKTPANYQSLARIIRTAPEIAVVGLNERDLLARDLKAKRTVIDLATIPRLHTTGFAKLLTNHAGHLLGVSIISPSAAALSYVFSLAISRHLTSIDSLL